MYVSNFPRMASMYICHMSLSPDLVEQRKVGVIDLLDEECKLPKGSPQHFTDSVHEQHKDHFRLQVREGGREGEVRGRGRRRERRVGK